MSVPLLQLKEVSKAFPGVQALDKVNLQIKPGEVLGLLGENGAGKSTLIKILTGAYQKDEGQIFWEGREVNISNPKEAISLGIACIYQELNLVPHLPIYENIFLGREPKAISAIGWLDQRQMIKRSAELLKELGLEINPKKKVETLGVGQQQMVEIAKALSVNAKLIIMDEPTASLSAHETNELLKTVIRLKERGIAVIFISHRMDEIYQVCDTVTILRDGKYVDSLALKDTNIEEIIRLMVGRSLDEKFPKVVVPRGEEALRVEGITRKGILNNISFTAYRGEVLGIAGLVGAGRTDLARAIFGADPRDSGEIYVNGERKDIKSPRDAIKCGIAFLTEDRKRQGLILMHSIAFNTTLIGLNEYARGTIINLKKANKDAERIIRDLQVRPFIMNRPTRQLSGGNQQKVVIAKWLLSKSNIFIFDEPTRGIDVGAKVEVYNLINQLVSNGACVIMISSELPEVLGMSDRILVMREGNLTAEFNRSEATQEKIMQAATGGR
ncbi:sugar ABC transporter ATP-binding protein [Desulfotomaculum nigrificans]|uniref:sugar ABC transporter ATP-binding protein n=1 Tax=Desulfotomaculum nigrificans TaxID=1565 RepID=UPI0001FAEC93|nr:sugar ABC transporter ATP-binding protein [Desulfotomaculum nigrificans]